MLFRDLGVAALMAALFWLDAMHLEGWLGTAVAVAAGASAGVVGFFIHEWGHLLGAWRARARVVAPDTIFSVFLFRFDVVRNSREQFLSMSWGGYAGSAVGSALILGCASFDVLSHQVAVVAVLLGFAATLILEVPIHRRISKGAPLPQEGVVYTQK